MRSIIKLASQNIVIVCCLLAPLHTVAALDKQSNSQPEWLTSLSVEVRDLLQQEMLALESGLKTATSALAKGEFNLLCETALQMKNSYILMQKLTKAQHHELHEKVPAEFLAADQEFHYYAGMLAHVAEKRNVELSVFYMSKIIESCANCHQSHAPHKFDQFETEAKPTHHNH